MYSISEVAKLTGITAFTLRYYEKIGVLPKPRRHNGQDSGGIRKYDEADLRMIRFIHGLKQSGMKLEDIADFTGDGCLLANSDMPGGDVSQMLHKRIDILDRHIGELEAQMEQLKAVKALSLEKKAYYAALFERLRNGSEEGSKLDPAASSE